MFKRLNQFISRRLSDDWGNWHCLGIRYKTITGCTISPDQSFFTNVGNWCMIADIESLFAKFLKNPGFRALMAQLSKKVCCHHIGDSLRQNTIWSNCHMSFNYIFPCWTVVLCKKTSEKSTTWWFVHYNKFIIFAHFEVHGLCNENWIRKIMKFFWSTFMELCTSTLLIILVVQSIWKHMCRKKYRKQLFSTKYVNRILKKFDFF